MKKVIAIVGPTASGKTQLAIELAQFLQTEIINVDSRQIYFDFNIATAKPSQNQLQSVKHYLVDCISPYENFTVKDFQVQAEKIIHHSHNSLILAGGTGLYFQALEKELDILPDIPKELRETLQKNYELYGIQYFIEELKLKDPKVLEHIDNKNPRRLSRALEVFLVSGKSILEFWNQNNQSPKYEFLWIGLDLGWEELEKNIKIRIENMFQEGLLEETQYLYQKYPSHLKAFEAIGYHEVLEYIQGKKNIQEVQELMYLKTRQYAKRQLTWFKKNKNILWLTKIDYEHVKILSENFIQ